MKSIIKSLAALTLAAAAGLSATAQELRSSYFMETSNFRHQMNPALLDSAGYVGIPFLGNINIGTTGNFGLKNFVYDLTPGMPGYGNGNTLTTFMNPGVDKNKFLDELHDNTRLGLYLNYNLFSVAFRAFGGTNLIELNLRSNTNVNLPKGLFELMKETGSQEQYSLTDIGLRTQNYAEIALGHSHKINDKWKVGAKMKFLVGLAYADIQSERLDLTMRNDHWAVNGDIRGTMAFGKMPFEHEDASKNDPRTGRQRISGFGDYSFSMPGFGLAFDLGATYKVLPDLTLSAALTDLGFIAWKNVNKASSAGQWEFDGFKNPIHVDGEEGEKLGDQFENIGDDLEELFSIYDDGTGKETKALAATLNIGAEYTLPVYRKLRFGFLYTSRFAGIHSWHQGMLSANIRPAKWFEFNLNGALSSTGGSWGMVVDFHAKHFNFFIGTDRWIGKLSKQFIPLNHMNTNINMGFTFPL